LGEQRPAIDELTGFAMDLIHQCGEKALDFYGKGRPQVKFDENLVTRAELEINEHFQAQLRAQYPEHQLFTGSQVDGNYTHDEKRYLWVFDPVDGVSNFSAGIPIWGTSIALLENFWPVFGAFFMPCTGDLFHAEAGGRAFRGDREIAISPQENIDDESLLLTYSRFHERYHTRFPGKIRNLGCTSAHICYVAMGRAEAAIIAHESFQDLAAVQVIAESAGGEIYRLKGSKFSPSEYLDSTDSDPEPLLVISPSLFSQVQACIFS
jgi:myo-inositol-1(or 4)-monophosphatase